MAGRTKSHSEAWWETIAAPHVVRCIARIKSTGGQCRRVAEDGSVVCNQHGGTAAQTIRRAAERVQFTADDAARQLVEFMADPAVDTRERAKIAQDLLDRAGLGAAQVHKIMPITEDPIEKMFASIFDDPNSLLEPDQPLLLRATVGPEYEQEPEPGPVDDVPIHRPQAIEAAAPKRNPLTPPKHIRRALDDLL